MKIMGASLFFFFSCWLKLIGSSHDPAIGHLAGPPSTQWSNGLFQQIADYRTTSTLQEPVQITSSQLPRYSISLLKPPTHDLFYPPPPIISISLFYILMDLPRAHCLVVLTMWPPSNGPQCPNTAYGLAPST